MHKVLTKEIAKEHGLLTPTYHYIEQGADVEEATAHIIRSFRQPVLVKPVSLGSSIGVSVVGGYAPLYAAIQTLVPAGGVLVEEFIKGTEVTVGVVENFRGEALYLLPPVEIVPPLTSLFFDTNAKYNGQTSEIVPGRFSKVHTQELMRQAGRMHEALGLRQYSRSDFILSPKGIYFLETNTLPGLTEHSLLPKSLQAVGVSLTEFLSHVVDTALTNDSQHTYG